MGGMQVMRPAHGRKGLPPNNNAPRPRKAIDSALANAHYKAMTKTKIAAAFGAAAAFLCIAAAAAAPLTVPFDYSRGAIGLDVTVKGTPLYMILDIGVDPSAIDVKRADALGLPVQRGAGGEASGEGDAVRAQIFPATIADLAMAGHGFGAVDAAAMDMSALSARYGRKLDGVLGYSFLSTRIVLIDYPHNTLSILASAADAMPSVQGCRTRYSVALRSFEGDQIPVIGEFRLGAATVPISLDTGSNKGIALFQGALAVPGMRGALTENGAIQSTGARGDTAMKTYVLNAPVGFGPFSLPAGQVVVASAQAGSADTRLANIGNRLFAAMKLKMLLDYRAHQMTFYGDCR